MRSEDDTTDESSAKLFRDYQRAVDNQDSEETTNVVQEVFAHVEEWCEEHSSPDLELSLRAAEFEECGDWDAAERTYLEILSLADCDSFAAHTAHSHLASLYGLLKRDSDALNHARLATASARQVEVSVLLAIALQSEAICQIRCGEIAVARGCIEEALGLVADNTAFNQLYASLLIDRAVCAMSNEAFAEAEDDLQQAFGLLEPRSAMEIAAGVQSDLSHWWSVTAKLRAERGDHECSLVAWQNAVDLSRTVDAQGHAVSVYTKYGVVSTLKGLGEALELSERATEAATVREERRQLLAGLGFQE